MSSTERSSLFQRAPECLRGRSAVVVLIAMAASIGIAPVPASAAPAVGECHYGPVAGGTKTDYAITWTPMAAVDAEAPGAGGGYVISRQVGGSGTWWWRTRAAPGSSAWFDNNSGSAGTAHSQYRIKTKDSSGNFGADVICQPLGTVENVRLGSTTPVIGASNITIDWDPVPGATGYRVLRAEDDNVAATVAVNVTGTTWTDTAVSNGHYTWSVVALATANDDASGFHTWESAPSNTTVTAPAGTTSVTPNLAVDSRSATISWRPVTGATGYNLHRWVAGASRPDAFLGWSTTTSRTDQLTNLGGEDVFWTVEATTTGNVRGNRVRSSVVSVAATDTLTMPGAAPITVTPGATHVESGERYATKEIDGRWELIDAADRDQPSPTKQRWQSIGVRYDNPGGLDAIDADVLDDIERQGFNAVRVPLHWIDVETSQGVYNQALLSDVDELVARADAAGLGVILDPIHLGGGAAAKFWIPQWAWTKAWTGSQAVATHPDDSTEVLMWDDPADPNDDDLGLAYLKYMLNRYKDEPAVVALELVNEPHPIAGNAWANTADIANLQADWVAELRTIDADKPLIVTGFFGGYLADGTKFTDAFTTNGTPNWDHVVFTAHTYYSGIGVTGDIDTDDDGYGDLDDPATYKRGSKAGTRVESYASRGCYGVAGYRGGVASSPYFCSTPSSATRAIAVTNLAAGLTAQDDVAQGASMPLFIGEFGSHPYRYVSTRSYTGWAGWGNADLMLCDQIKALRQVGGTNEVSYSAWDLTTGGFGIYDLDARTWNDLGDQFADTSCTG